jgi:hypothetical protein
LSFSHEKLAPKAKRFFFTYHTVDAGNPGFAFPQEFSLRSSAPSAPAFTDPPDAGYPPDITFSEFFVLEELENESLRADFSSVFPITYCSGQPATLSDAVLGFTFRTITAS